MDKSGPQQKREEEIFEVKVPYSADEKGNRKGKGNAN